MSALFELTVNRCGDKASRARLCEQYVTITSWHVKARKVSMQLLSKAGEQALVHSPANVHVLRMLLEATPHGQSSVRRMLHSLCKDNNSVQLWLLYLEVSIRPVAQLPPSERHTNHTAVHRARTVFESLLANEAW